ncbi:OB-fold nucleic acid binding domain-containing protein [Methanopyrus sp.]
MSEELSRRYPAVRVPAGELAHSQPTEDGFVTPKGVRFHRALVVGVLSGRYVDEDREFAVITVTDDTGSVDVFAFDECYEPARTLEKWRQIKVIGRPMEPREEGRPVTLRAEVIRPTSHSEEIFRRLEYELMVEGEAPATVEEAPTLDEVIEMVYRELLERDEETFSREDLHEVIRQVVPHADEELCEKIIKEMEERELLYPMDLPGGKRWSVIEAGWGP